MLAFCICKDRHHIPTRSICGASESNYPYIDQGATFCVRNSKVSSNLVTTHCDIFSQRPLLIRSLNATGLLYIEPTLRLNCTCFDGRWLRNSSPNNGHSSYPPKIPSNVATTNQTKLRWPNTLPQPVLKPTPRGQLTKRTKHQHLQPLVKIQEPRHLPVQRQKSFQRRLGRQPQKQRRRKGTTRTYRLHLPLQSPVSFPKYRSVKRRNQGPLTTGLSK